MLPYGRLKLRKINTLMMFLNQMFSSSFYPLISRPTRITSRSAALFENIFVKGDLTRDNLQQRCFAQQCCAKHRSTCNMVSGTIFCATFYSATRCEFLKPSQKLATQVGSCYRDAVDFLRNAFPEFLPLPISREI